MLFHSASGLEGLLRGCVEVHGNAVRIIDAGRLREERIDALVYNAMFQPSERVRYFLAWLIRQVAAGNAIYPSSLQGWYARVGRGQAPSFTIPALRLRMISYAAGRAAFRAMRETGAGAVVFSLDGAAKPAQSPLDYATCLLAAAIREGYEGPLFLEADFLRAQPGADERLKELVGEALNAGFFNLEFGLTRLKNLSLPDPTEQEQAYSTDCAALAGFVRQAEPAGVGSAIGIRFDAALEQLVLRLRTFVPGFETEFTSRAGHVPGIGKFDLSLGRVEDLGQAKDFAEVALREFYLPTSVSLEGEAVEDELIEAVATFPWVGVNLGARLEAQMFVHPAFPSQLRQEMQRWLETACPGRGDSVRPWAYEQFKRELWDLPEEIQEAIMAELQASLVDTIRWFKADDSIHLMIEAVNIQQTELPRPVEGYHQDAETYYRDILDRLG